MEQPNINRPYPSTEDTEETIEESGEHEDRTKIVNLSCSKCGHFNPRLLGIKLKPEQEVDMTFLCCYCGYLFTAFFQTGSNPEIKIEEINRSYLG